METLGGNNKIWLIKSSGMIMGPYSLEEVIENLEERRISIIDEIRSPSTRWSFIREHAKFKEVVQFLRERQSTQKEDTGLTTSGTKTITNTGLQDEVTVTPVVPTSAPIEEDDGVEVLETSWDRSQEKPITYAFSADRTVKKNLRKKRRRFAFIAWTAFVVVVAVLISVQYLAPQKSPKALSMEDYLRLAKSNRALGNSEGALDFFKKAETLKPLDTASQLQMIPLMMRVENQNVRARQLLEQIAVNPMDPRTMNQVESFLALSYLREGQLDEAERRYQALAYKNPNQESHRMNLTEIMILKGQFELAVKSLVDMSKEGLQDLNVLLYRALAVYRASEANFQKGRLEKSLEDLKRYMSKTQDYKPESLLLTLAIQKRLGLDLDAGVTAGQLINVYPDLTREHNHDEMIHGEIFQWNYLSNICGELVKLGGVSPAYMGLQSYCSYQTGDLKTSLEQIEKTHNQFSKEALVVGLHAFLLMKAGRNSEAAAQFQLPQSEQAPLIHAVQARWCAGEKDWGCVKQQWEDFQKQEPSGVEAFVGLAEMALAKGQKDMASDFVKQGLLISGNYRPLLILKEQLDD